MLPEVSRKLDLPQWGGRREGAGRPRTRPHPGLEGPGVPHLERPELNRRHPVHLTLRVQPGIHVVDYVILGNHLHLIVEAEDEAALSRGMQAIGIRIGKRLNQLQNRRGGVFVDRYHAHHLKTRRETAHALRYITQNYRRHTYEYLPPRWADPLAGRLAQPRT